MRDTQRYNPRPAMRVSILITLFAALLGALAPLLAWAQELFVSSGGSNQVLRYNGTTGASIDAFVTAGSGGLILPQGLVFRSSAAIPTLSEWAQIGMLALLVGGGLWGMRKRSAVSHQRSA